MASSNNPASPLGANSNPSSTILAKLPDSLQSYFDSSLVQLQSAYSSLPPSTQAHLATLYKTTHLDSIPPPALASIFLILFTTTTVVTMSGWGRSFFSGGSSSRFSPFGSRSHPPNVTDQDFSYITSADLQQPGRSYDPHSRPVAPSMQAEDDVLLVKNKGITYPIKFPAYSIGDGKLQVRDVKDRAAIALDRPSGKGLKLLYKGQHLKDDFALCRDYGLKNQSEILCVVGEIPAAAEEDSGDSEDESNSATPDGSTKKKRVRKSKKKKGKSSTNLSPEGVEGAGSSANSRGASPGAPPAPKPVTAVEKLAAISSHFHVKILPLCVQFTNAPPEDPKKKDFEHKKLSETIMNEVLLKLDAVETWDDLDAREKRKALVRETQGVLNGLDAVMGK